MYQLLLLLLPVAAISGWIAGYRHKRSMEVIERAPKLFSHDYLLGLNYLINEQPDKAVDVFIKMISVDTDTVETHLALGSLFRRRGEVDRAIRIHQNLIARPQLMRHQRIQALYELAQDYLRAGVLDRAERLFLELLSLEGEVVNSLNSLINIYQQQKDWLQAIVMAKKLEKLNKISMGNAIAHYYCELAEQFLDTNKNEQAHNYLLDALKHDEHCVRASIISGRLFAKSGEYKKAILSFHRVYEQDKEYISEVITDLSGCYKKLDRESDFVDYLTEKINDTHCMCFVFVMADYICNTTGNDAAIEYLSKNVHNCNSTHYLGYLLKFYLKSIEGSDNSVKSQLLLLVDKITESRLAYRCIHCGFASKQLYWQCPSCKRWNSIKPIYD